MTLHPPYTLQIPFADIDTMKILPDNIPPPPTLFRIKVGTSGNNSGAKRFWTLVKRLYGGADNALDMFFEDCFVYNFCPLGFLDDQKKPKTWEELVAKKDPYIVHIERICRKTLKELIKLLRPKLIVGVGNYVHNQLELMGNDVQNQLELIELLNSRVKIPHPSGNNPSYSEGRSYNTLVKEQVIREILETRNIESQ